MTSALLPTDSPNWDPLLPTKEAAAYLNLAPDTLLLMARRREIACVRASKLKGSTVKFRLSALNSWIRAHEQRPLRAAH